MRLDEDAMLTVVVTLLLFLAIFFTPYVIVKLVKTEAIFYLCEIATSPLRGSSQHSIC